MSLSRKAVSIIAMCVLPALASSVHADFEQQVRPLLAKYCLDCHSGDDAKGDLDFIAIRSKVDIAEAYATWERVDKHLAERSMPPEGELQPSDKERDIFRTWYGVFLESIEAQPAEFTSRRLSVLEFRNTLRSVLGFDLLVAIIEAEQTLAERSMVIKLLPTDPPGKSGFKNDTHSNPLSAVAWDQYSRLIDMALDQLFSQKRRDELERLTGSFTGHLNITQAEQLLRNFLWRVYRRPAAEGDVEAVLRNLQGLHGEALVAALKFEMKSQLMSPKFLYRGLLMPKPKSNLDAATPRRLAVDNFELAERLSYFLWADMPDEHLIKLAQQGSLTEQRVIEVEIDRMLASPKARSLAEVFATEWLTLDAIEHVSDNPPVMLALKSQAIDFIHYLFTQDRPLLELIDSDTTFINPHTARMYGQDAKQMSKYKRQKGIEIEAIPNQKIELRETSERGGILTMPGILAMNRGPILRGTWILERILGEELPEPPANVGVVPPRRPGEDLSFRERFEQHRENASCAVCHDKIDPLGFALQEFDTQGQYVHHANYRVNPKKRDKEFDPGTKIDVTGQLPSGEEFDGIEELKKILVASQREAVIRNIVQRTLAYALCRELRIYDRPTVEQITQKMLSTADATWRDLFLEIANSVPFRETILN